MYSGVDPLLEIDYRVDKSTAAPKGMKKGDAKAPAPSKAPPRSLSASVSTSFAENKKDLSSSAKPVPAASIMRDGEGAIAPKTLQAASMPTPVPKTAASEPQRSVKDLLKEAEERDQFSRQTATRASRASTLLAPAAKEQESAVSTPPPPPPPAPVFDPSPMESIAESPVEAEESKGRDSAPEVEVPETVVDRAVARAEEGLPPPADLPPEAKLLPQLPFGFCLHTTREWDTFHSRIVDHETLKVQPSDVQGVDDAARGPAVALLNFAVTDVPKRTL